MNTSRSDRSRIYANPYLSGFLLGMVLLATFYITGRGLGASGAMKSTVVTAVNAVAHKFGGGGHTSASGCTIEGDVEEIKKKILDELRNYM